MTHDLFPKNILSLNRKVFEIRFILMHFYAHSLFERHGTGFLHMLMWCVLIHQRDAAFLINNLYYPLVSSTCFGLSPVHHQSSCCVDVHPRNS